MHDDLYCAHCLYLYYQKNPRRVGLQHLQSSTEIFLEKQKKRKKQRLKFAEKKSVCLDAEDAVDLLELIPSNLEALVCLGDELGPLPRPSPTVQKQNEKRG